MSDICSLISSADLISPKGLRNIAQGCRAATTLGSKRGGTQTPTGFRRWPWGLRVATRRFRNPVGVYDNRVSNSQGSGCAATLGCVTQALRAMKRARRHGKPRWNKNRHGHQTHFPTKIHVVLAAHTECACYISCGTYSFAGSCLGHLLESRTLLWQMLQGGVGLLKRLPGRLLKRRGILLRDAVGRETRDRVSQATASHAGDGRCTPSRPACRRPSSTDARHPDDTGPCAARALEWGPRYFIQA